MKHSDDFIICPVILKTYEYEILVLPNIYILKQEVIMSANDTSFVIFEEKKCLVE